jgi:hypothetical protein
MTARSISASPFSACGEHFASLHRIYRWIVTRAPYNKGGNMNPTRNPGRVAGLWYLLLCVLGPLRLMYIPSKLFVHGNATATANNIAAHEWLFRFGMVSDLVGAVVAIFLALALYRLFKGVDQYLAVLVVILGGVMPSLLYFVNVVSDAGALMVARGPDFLSVFNKPQRDALVMLLLRLHDHPKHCRGDPLGSVASSVSDACVQVALPAALSWRLARHQRLRLRDPEFYRPTVTAIWK